MNAFTCPVCDGPINFRFGTTRKAQKPCLNMRCRSDGRHFRAFIMDRDFVERMLDEAGSDSEQAS